MRATLLIVSLLGFSSAARVAWGDCVDEELRDNLLGQRPRRGAVIRRFQKAHRHEFTAWGGWLAADLADGTPTFGGAYTFHLGEELGFELSYLRHQRQYGMVGVLLNQQGQWVTLDSSPRETIHTMTGNFVLSLAYGKVRWLGGAISAIDLRLNLGAGVQAEPRRLAIVGDVGLGLEAFLTEWLAVRFDVRDRLHPEHAPLGANLVVNDIAALAGISLYVPFRNRRGRGDWAAH